VTVMPAAVRLLFQGADRRRAAGGLGVLLLHGWQNRKPAGHWMRLLAEELTARGHQAVYPQLPDPDEPSLAAWTAAAAEGLAELSGARRVVVGHSLGAVTWLHLAATGALPPVDRVALVAPPGREFLRYTPELAEFGYEQGPGKPLGARSGRLVYSDDDPYCAEGAASVYGGVPGLTAVLLPGQGHLDLDAGYGDWPSMLAWCEAADADGAAAIAARSARSPITITG
jgi:predicted alpha/beta hydrolase family esterase